MASDIDKEIAHALSHKSPKTCCRFWHSWGRWADTEKYEITRGKTDPDAPRRVVGHATVQERRCKDCHELQSRVVNTEVI